MNYQALPGPPAAEANPIVEMLPLIAREARRRALGMSIAFACIALAFLVVGLLFPKRYTSETTILVSEGNIIAPLMEGRAVATSAADRARIAGEVVFSRRIMQQILQAGGWTEGEPSALALERIAEEIKDRTTISTPGENLVRISYRDSDPERAFVVAQRFAELFIEASLEAKERESREAYEFIAQRVEEYHRKLVDAENRLKQFRAQNLEARPGSDEDVRVRVGEVRSQIERARTELTEMQMRERDLLEQLSGEAEVDDERRQSNIYQQRIQEMTAELERLRLDYTDAHPDVRRVRQQILDMQDLLQRQRAAETVRGGDGSAGSSPLFQQLQSTLARTRSDIAGLRARIAESERLLEEALERGRRIADSEADLAELTRDYEVNRDLHQDLLRRRENARVSMSLDAERRGLTFRVQEPAALPLRASGIRLMHFMAAGLLLGLAIPVTGLIALLRLDPRARNGQQLALAAGLPLLVTVPEYQTRPDRKRNAIRLAFAAIAAAVVVLAYGVVALQRGAPVL